MSGRPEVLFPLFAEITGLDGIGPKTAQALAKAGLETPRDVLFTLPYTGIDRRIIGTTLGLSLPADVTVEVSVLRHIPSRGKRGPVKAQVEDSETSFNLVFFHGGEWALRQLPVGARKVVSGRLEPFDGLAEMAHPDHILDRAAAADLPEFEAVYSRLQDVSPKTLARGALSALERAPVLAEWADPALIEREAWPTWRDAIRAAHSPKSSTDLSLAAPARQRLAYDELLAHQLTLALARSAARSKPGLVTRGGRHLRDRVLSALAYAPTGAQMRATAEIDADMSAATRMNRLLQGDVGSGKTLVAFLALLSAVEAGGQGALMAPTEILARQHLESLQPLAENAGVVFEILTGRDKGRERAAKLAALASGDIQILVGTHAVFQKDVTFRDLRLAVIDEQHRFGVAQRMELGEKGASADVLVMTATPIPRSLSLAQYGHMDVSVLDEKPPGRKPVTTALISSGRIDEVVGHLRRAIDDGRQAYWVCPLVEESETLDMTAAEDRFARLRAALGDNVVGLVHGQLP
ncbi:MAG: ATP-dependent DNA helicase RecG, partial [Pseudomonadota bacterium]